ncbi:hypothetical protein COY23_01955 [bacterium (Candidatus Torokbacteria) CG_4_10_14_0_2_um_filter_35_8]|nr:MAG: hypothetical protein COY23_01955 [bacterium (Candidatus Torokbacteria) CG_4_10_14_0_2_um_filter_35_8]
MKISGTLPQFSEEKALLVVASRYEADFYFAENGMIDKIQSFRVEESTYSDREDFTERKGRGNFFMTGSGYQSPKVQVIQDFAKEFKENLKDVLSKNDITSIYLFVPSEMVNEIKEKLDNLSKKKIKFVFKGDYNKEHAFKLLEKIKAKIDEKKVIPKSEEIRKILEKRKK